MQLSDADSEAQSSRTAGRKAPSSDPFEDWRATILGRVVQELVTGHGLTADQAADQILLFANSVLSKSLASTLTSFVLALAKESSA